jgi:hypothetical protein
MTKPILCTLSLCLSLVWSACGGHDAPAPPAASPVATATKATDTRVEPGTAAPVEGSAPEQPGSSGDAATSGSPIATAGGHAPKGVVPGSHEDWCGEHAVPESLCTRCNPSLIPAFQATGDWCPEHGVPESQCLRCNPKLQIVRPPRKGEGT